MHDSAQTIPNDLHAVGILRTQTVCLEFLPDWLLAISRTVSLSLMCCVLRYCMIKKILETQLLNRISVHEIIFFFCNITKMYGGGILMSHSFFFM